jgi:hypothetical protein
MEYFLHNILLGQVYDQSRDDVVQLVKTVDNSVGLPRGSHAVVEMTGFHPLPNRTHVQLFTPLVELLGDLPESGHVLPTPDLLGDVQDVFILISTPDFTIL